MDNHAKYIMLKTHEGTKVPIVFSPTLVHKHVANRLLPFGTPASAGFVDFNGGIVSCFGRSETLKLDAQADDVRIITSHFGLRLMRA